MESMTHRANARGMDLQVYLEKYLVAIGARKRSVRKSKATKVARGNNC